MNFIKRLFIIDPVFRHFANPKNRLQALIYVKEQLTLNPSIKYICHALEGYINHQSKFNYIKISLTGCYDDPSMRKHEYQLHKLIPELVHPYEVLNTKKTSYPFQTCWLTNNCWGTMLIEMYNTNSHAARLLHIQNAINKIQSYGR